jgi:CheY-like chemotaxis protein
VFFYQDIKMGQQKILLVDDDVDFLEVTASLLEEGGYEVDTAVSGKDARKRVLDVSPDLIVLDVMMETDLAGVETARWLRSQEATRKTPIIMLTGVNQEVPFKLGPDDIWLPVDEFLEKPVSGDRLLGVVRQKLPLENDS